MNKPVKARKKKVVDLNGAISRVINNEFTNTNLVDDITDQLLYDKTFHKALQAEVAKGVKALRAGK